MAGAALFSPGRVAVVTGAGPGMGRSIAVQLAEAGVEVAIAARRADRLAEVADAVRAAGREPLVVPVDITDPAACHALVDGVVGRFGRLDVLVQNAHHEGDWSAVAEADADAWRAVFEVNVFGALHLVHAAVPAMRAAGGGAIVLVNSGAAVRFPRNMGAYAASKSALAAIARTLAVEVGAHRIRVNGVFLGPVEGENLRRLGTGAAQAAGLSIEEWMDVKATEMPLGWVPTPDECARPVVFLASDLASVITGQHLSVNGGQWLT